MIKNEPSEIRPTQDKFYGIYRGVVEENNDSEQFGGSGRVKVRVWGLHTKKLEQTETEGIPVTGLVWAQPAYPIFEGSISQVGFWSVPVQGTHVFLFFENGDHMQPRYFACVPGIEPDEFEFEGGFCDPDGVYPTEASLGEPDHSSVARGIRDDNCFDYMGEATATGGSCPGVTVTEPGIESGEYPFISTLQTRAGHVLSFDSSEGKENLILYHPGKSYMYINNNADVVIKSEGSTIEISLADRKIGIKGSSTRAVGGNETIGVDGSWTVSATSINVMADVVSVGCCNGPYYKVALENHIHSGVTKGGDKSGPPVCIDEGGEAIAGCLSECTEVN